MVHTLNSNKPWFLKHEFSMSFSRPYLLCAFIGNNNNNKKSTFKIIILFHNIVITFIFIKLKKYDIVCFMNMFKLLQI